MFALITIGILFVFVGLMATLEAFQNKEGEN